MCQGSSISNRRDHQYRFLNNLEYSKVSEHRFWFFNDSEMMDISREWTTILICQYHEMGTCLRWYFKGLITDTFFWTILTMSEEWSWTIENLECIRRVLSTDSDFLIILKYWTYQGSKYQFLFVVRRSVRRWVPTLVARWYFKEERPPILVSEQSWILYVRMSEHRFPKTTHNAI